MKTSFATAALIAALVSGGAAANAAETSTAKPAAHPQAAAHSPSQQKAAAHTGTHHVASGRIAKLDTAKRRLVINNQTYRYAAKSAVAGLQEGGRVKVFYHQSGSHRNAYRIVPIAS